MIIYKNQAIKKAQDGTVVGPAPQTEKFLFRKRPLDITGTSPVEEAPATALDSASARFIDTVMKARAAQGQRKPEFLHLAPERELPQKYSPRVENIKNYSDRIYQGAIKR
jgi:hypothetical protein